MQKLQLKGNNICFVGDIHGEYTSIKNTINYYKLNKCVIFFCGDIGLGFNKEQYYKDIFKKINRFCKEREIELVFIRGNHDDPTYFNEQKISYSNIRTVADYTLVEVQTVNKTYNILCIGGATSIDRSYRKGVMSTSAVLFTQHHNCSLEDAYKQISKVYWEDEYPVYDEQSLSEIIDSVKVIDIVASHTCPNYAPPTTKNNLSSWAIGDSTLIEDVRKERNVMDNIFNYIAKSDVKLKYWIYGHYHWYEQSNYNGVKFVMLDMCRNNKLCLFPIDIDNDNI